MRRSSKRLLITAIPVAALALVATTAAGASATSANPMVTTARQHTVAHAAPAHPASSSFITGTVEANPVLNVRSAPNTNNPPISTIPFGARIDIACYNTGQTVSANWGGQTWTTNVWDGLWDGSTGGFNGAYVSDAWVNTGGNTANFVPHC